MTRPNSEQAFEEGFRVAIAQGFAGRTTMGMRDAANLLKMDEKTLRRHLARGNITFIETGTGDERMRRVFTPNDLLGFYAGQRRRQAATPDQPARPWAGRRSVRFADAVPKPVRASGAASTGGA